VWIVCRYRLACCFLHLNMVVVSKLVCICETLNTKKYVYDVIKLKSSINNILLVKIAPTVYSDEPLKVSQVK